MVYANVYQGEMSDDAFTDPDEPAEDWADVRMTDPDEGEWDLDAVVLGGRVEHVDLLVRPDLLAEFVDCLLDDVSADRAEQILAEVAQRQGIDRSERPAEE